MIVDSAKLKRIRESKKMSQAELAAGLELSQATVWEWEKQDHNVKLEHILKLADILETDMNVLLKEGLALHISNHINNLQAIKTSAGTGVNEEAYELQKDIIVQLKKQIALLELELKRMKGETNK